MGVHVGTIHTDLSGARSEASRAPGEGAASAPSHPGAPEDEWRAAQARVEHLRGRVCAQDFDD